MGRLVYLDHSYRDLYLELYIPGIKDQGSQEIRREEKNEHRRNSNNHCYVGDIYRRFRILFRQDGKRREVGGLNTGILTSGLSF